RCEKRCSNFHDIPDNMGKSRHERLRHGTRPAQPRRCPPRRYDPRDSACETHVGPWPDQIHRQGPRTHAPADSWRNYREDGNNGADPETTCLVELDEEPPHQLDPEAVDIALTISLLLHARPMDEVHVMRKVVIDGSNTTGFQRTAIISLNGKLDADGKEIPIQQISLEEDAGRKTGENKNTVIFRLDRLGVPLIEIATGPVIKDAQEAGRVALAIGQVLRATKKVKRGLGSIRQDLNVSIEEGALIEIKGV